MGEQPCGFVRIHPGSLQMVGDVFAGHAQPTSFLNRDRVALDLGRPIHVRESLVPQIQPLVELAQMGELVQQVEIEIPILAAAKVSLRHHDAGHVDVDEGVAAITADLHTRPFEQAIARGGKRGDA